MNDFGRVGADRVGERVLACVQACPNGRVAHVSPNCKTLRLADGCVLALLPADKPIHPFAFGIRLETDAFLAGGLVTFSAGRLTDGRTQIDLARLPAARARLDKRPGLLSEDVWAAIRSRGRVEPPGPFDAFLAEQLAAFHESRSIASLEALLGVGEGLTPSGDDILVGILAGLDLGRDWAPENRASRAGIVAGLRPKALERTVRLAAQLLDAAMDGVYAEPVVELLDALAVGHRSSELGPALDRVAALGHRSGRDLLRGLAVGLRAGASRVHQDS